MKKHNRIYATATGLVKNSRLLFFFLCIQLCHAKKTYPPKFSRDLLYTKSNIYMTAHPAFSPKPKITSFDDPYHLDVKLKGVMNFNFGFVYLYNFNKYMGISIGLYNAFLSFKVIKFDYTIPDAIMNSLNLYPDHCFKCKEFINHATTFPIRYIYRNGLTSKTDFVISAGMDIQLQKSFYYEFNDARGIIGMDTSSFTTFTLLLESEGNKKLTVTPYFGCSVGINQFLKNNDYINYQFSAHIPLINPYKNGNFYVLPNTAYAEHGKYKLNPMSFGLQVNYVFTFYRRKLRKK